MAVGKAERRGSVKGPRQDCELGGTDVFAYFNNDPEGMAVINALELKSLTADK